MVVANDEAAANELVTMTLRMATPPGIKVAVKTVREAVSLFHDKRTAGLKILIVVDKPCDALKLVRQVPGFPVSISATSAALATAGDAGR